jgi:putative MATE family efflux protein
MFYNKAVSKVYENGHCISVSSIALPKYLEMIFIQMINTVNTLMLSDFSREAVAATSVAGQIQNLIIVILNIIIAGTGILMSVELGKNDRKNASEIAGTSIVMIVFCSVIIGLLAFVFSGQLMDIMNLSGKSKNLAVDFFKIKMLFLFIKMSMSWINNLLICNGYAFYAVIVGVCCNLLNVTFGYIVLYSSLNLPMSRVSGIAFASVFAEVISLILAGVFLLKKKCPFCFGFNVKLMKKILKIGTPSGLGLVSYSFTQIITTGFMASFGIIVLNAKVYISNIINYTSQFGYAISQANGVLVGRYRGKQDFASMKTLHKQNMKVAVISNLTLSLIVLLFHRQLISIFSDNSEIIRLAGVVMGIDVAVEVARAVNNISEQSLNANGDVKATFFIPFFTCWVFGVGLAYILGVKYQMGLTGCWIAFASDEILKCILYTGRWKKEKWKNTDI